MHCVHACSPHLLPPSLAVLSQLLAGFFRPALDSLARNYFNLGHRWLGRITIVMAWVVIYLGISLYHTGIFKTSLIPWITPVAMSMGVIVLLDIILTVVGHSKTTPPGAPSPESSVEFNDATRELTQQSGLETKLSSQPMSA